MPTPTCQTWARGALPCCNLSLRIAIFCPEPGINLDQAEAPPLADNDIRHTLLNHLGECVAMDLEVFYHHVRFN